MANTHNDGIDILRGFSVLSVILLHCCIHMPFDHTHMPEIVYRTIFWSGYYGVITFFVISGFLITTNALKRWHCPQSIHILDFYRMRFARIIPCLIGLLIILSIFHLMAFKGFRIHTTTLSEALFAAVTFHINLLECRTGYLPGSWDILWTLSVEEVFYLLFPIICLFSKKSWMMILFLVAFILMGPFSRTMYPQNEILSECSYLSCMDGLAIGCLTAFIAQSIQYTKRRLLFMAISGFILSTFVIVFRKCTSILCLPQMGIDFTLLAVGIALLLLTSQGWYIGHKHKGSFWTAPTRWFGRYSYEIYLSHMFFVTFFSEHIYDATQSVWIILGSYGFIMILAGFLGRCIAKYFSNPLNKAIRKQAVNYSAVSMQETS